MTTTIKRWRYFLAHQDFVQQAWLEEQARRGWHLARPGLFRFAFTQGEPSQEKYRLDFQLLRGDARTEYLALFREAGCDFIGQVANLYYFRARPDAFSPEIFSDVASRRDRIRRQMQFVAPVTALLALQTSLIGTRLLSALGGEASSMSPAMLGAIGLATAGFTGFGAWCIWRMNQAYQRMR